MSEEIWKDIPGYEGKYQVSNLGNIRSLNYRGTGKKRLLGQWENFGYKITHLSRDGRTITIGVHRLVALAFIDNPNQKAEINHLDGDKKNNIVDNLEWVTRGENQKHKYRMLGYEPVRARLKPVIDITNGKEFDSVRSVAREMGVWHGAITRAIKLSIKCHGHRFKYK